MNSSVLKNGKSSKFYDTLMILVIRVLNKDTANKYVSNAVISKQFCKIKYDTYV